MENNGADIIAGIRELRAKAAEQLVGNEYYMIVQQLDALAQARDLKAELVEAVLTTIRMRLNNRAPEAEPPAETSPHPFDEVEPSSPRRSRARSARRKRPYRSAIRRRKKPHRPAKTARPR
ncbi:MAG: hypothetical protein HC850_07795, partial [Rhodomicrobium sp.]|nr:hypothetical protein [Rhodomicrobium sp.]